MEPPEFYNKFLADLASYEPTAMSAYAYSINSRKLISYQDDDNLQLTMVRGTNLISSVEPIDSQTMRFTWHSFY